MTNKNDMRTTVGVACVVVLLLVAGVVGSSNYGRREIRKTWSGVSGEWVDRSDIIEDDATMAGLLLAGAPFLFAVAVCGLATGILGAVVIPDGEAGSDDGGSENDRRKGEFAAAVATALPTIAVRLDSAGATEPLTVIDEFATTSSWARV